MSQNNLDLSADFDAVFAYFDKMDQQLDPYVRYTMEALGNHLLNLIFHHAPKRRGRYASSWTKRWTDGSTLQIYTPEKELFGWLEHTGTVDHDVEAKNAKTLHWKDEAGVDHFAFRTHPSGMKPQPHLRPALITWEQDKNIIVLASAAITLNIKDPSVQYYVSSFARIGSVAGDHIEVPLKRYRISPV